VLKRRRLELTVECAAQTEKEEILPAKSESGITLQRGINLEKVSGERGQPHTKTEDNEMSEQQSRSKIDA
jgi:hypothetical protein